ncbi:MAG: DNA replication/repair protein RecF [Cellvibrionaceae bacterium]|nr:DNA replication/repair protein RecF [Cellvibrionaceae bacterium]
MRNLKQVSLDLSPTINIFYGNNGSGKTSLLESVSLLGLGRSFRSYKNRSLINAEAKELLVFAEIHKDQQIIPVGIQKNTKGETRIKIDGESAQSAVSLAQQLPLQIIDASAFALIEGPSGQRRRFLDWMVFHVKPDFVVLWRRLQRVLKQRNQLLRRDKITALEIQPWDKELSALAVDIHQLRASVFELFLAQLNALTPSFLVTNNIMDLDIRYEPGWDTQQAFMDLLSHHFVRDQHLGYTAFGPQRSDIKIKINNKPAAEVLSRGQEKALICAFHIAQAKLFQEQRQESCVFLVDDLLAELDKHNADKLIDWLIELKGQTLITGIDRDALLGLWAQKNKPTEFHVEQGDIRSCSFEKKECL